MMIQLLEGGTYLVNGTELVEPAKAAAQGLPAPEEAAKQTMAYNILRDHNTSGNMEKLQIKFDKLTSHDITFVDSKSLRTGKVPGTVCTDQLPQLSVCCWRNHQ